MNCRIAWLACSVLAGSASAVWAQPVTGLYIGGGVGANFREPSGTPTGNTHITTDPGPIGVLSLGWGLGNGLRAELEGSYRSNDVNALATRRVNGLVIDTGAVTGRVGTAAAMANLLYDIDLSRFGLPVMPYIGAGVGYGFRQDDNITGHEPLSLTLPNHIMVQGNGFTERHGTYGSPAYQAIGGVAVPLRFVPGLALTVEYRYLTMPRTRFGGSSTILTTNTVAGLQPTTRGHGYDDSENHSVLVGLRYAFSSAPPPVAPGPEQAAPAPAAARTYLVFFDWDRADLTTRARQIIAEAAQATTRTQVTRIEVDGYTDRSGTAAYNKALSVRRAQNVAAELVRLGVPRAAISVQGFGEADPLVPTAAGVREPQNRRVQIILR